MLKLLKSKWRIALIATLILAIATPVGLWGLIQSVSQASDAACATLEAADYDDASALADRCDADVEVVSERTPWQTSWASTSNGGRLDVTSMPSRVLDEGEWTELDTTLVTEPESGEIEVSAPVFPITLNPGGALGRGKPLASIEREGKKLDVWFPLALPTPTLSGDHARYALAEGVVLFVSINDDGTGVLPVVRLRDRPAAQLFTTLLERARSASDSALTGMEIEFEMAFDDGLSLSADEGGAVRIVDAKGESHFTSANPAMWDSTGANAAVGETVTESGPVDRTETPADGDKRAVMDVRVDGKSIIVTPDEAMLTSSTTTWPVYIDPEFAGHGASEWVAVRTGGYTGTLYKWDDISATSPGQGTGNCTQVATCGTSFKQRLVWEFSGLSLLSGMTGADIKNAQMKVNAVHSATCTATKTELIRTSSISASTTWTNLSWASSAYGSRTEAHSATCGGRGYKEFTATNGAKWMADENKSSISMGLRVADETTMTSWKRFEKNATFQVEYNRAPSIPTKLQIDSPLVTVCATGAARPIIASTTPLLSAVSSDPDGGSVYTSFRVTNAANSTEVKWTSPNTAKPAADSRWKAQVPSGALVNGGVYAWSARSYDTDRYSAWSPSCEFAVDTSIPPGPLVKAIATGADALYSEGNERGGVGQKGVFEIDRGTATDVVGFSYGFNSSSLSTPATPGADGKATITFTPTVAGPVTLAVRSRDAGGNLSAISYYQFEVATAAEDGAWTFDEGVGEEASDSAGAPELPLSIGGAQWIDGPHQLFESREGDHALLFNGTSAAATSEAPVVDTTKSFVVSAHVKLDAGKTGLGQSFTALGQDGVTSSGFSLGYSASCTTSTNGCWSFSMPDDNAGTASTAVFSSSAVKSGEWVYLVGEHDVTANKLRLWTCDIGTPDAPAVGDLVRNEASRTASPWAASGAFTVGRSLAAGASGNWWPGAIDNVRVFSGDILAESKLRRLCQGAEPTDFAQGGAELDPTASNER